MSDRLPVLIIGAGLGGLNLAHSLKAHRIPFRVFERDSASSARAQGYRFGIDEGGVTGLHTALSPDLFDLFEATCAEQHKAGGRIDGMTGKVLQSGILGMITAGGWSMIPELAARYTSSKIWGLPIQPATAKYALSSLPSLSPGPNKHYQVDRRVLRSLLLSSVSDSVTYDAAFSSYTVEPDGVTAQFADGASIRGSLLVGADGTRSRVAAQLLGARGAPLDLGIRIVYGKTPLTPAVAEALHPTLQRGTSFVVGTDAAGRRILLVLEAMRFHHERCPEDYIFWTLSASTETFGMDDDALLASQGAKGAAITRHLTANFDPSIRIIFDDQAEDETAVMRMMTSNPDGPVVWDTNRRFSLLGDSVHCMPPTGGQGANSALWEAAMLGAVLAAPDAADARGGWTETAIGGYEVAMRHNLGDVVGMACIAAWRIIRQRPFDQAALAARP